MVMKRSSILPGYILLALVIMASANLSSAQNGWNRKVTNTQYRLSGKEIVQRVIEIENKSDENLWLFFEKDSVGSNRNIIRKRFFRSPSGEMSLFQWMVDGNVNWGELCPDIYDRWFFKIIPPHDSFHIVLIGNDISKFEHVEKQIRILTQLEMQDIHGGFKCITAPKTHPSYQENIITIPIELFESNE